MKLTTIKFFRAHTALFATLIALAGCEKEEVGPKMLITDNDGVEISLEWNTNNGIDRAKDEIDMDLYLTKGKRTVEASVTRDFEYVELFRSEADGEYDIKIRRTRISREGTFLFNVYGKSAQSRTLRFSGEVRPIQQSPAETAVLRIHKSGNEFRVVQLD